MEITAGSDTTDEGRSVEKGGGDREKLGREYWSKFSLISSKQELPLYRVQCMNLINYLPNKMGKYVITHECMSTTNYFLIKWGNV